MNDRFLKILACPVCYRSLCFIKLQHVLICKFDKLSFSILQGVPVLLKNQSKDIFI